MIFALIFLTSVSSFADSNPYCTESEQHIRNFVIKDPLALDEKSLLRNGESISDLKTLAIQPGPYGHSELGFRYLVKFFGYEGDSYEVADIERWILQGEYFTNDNRSGTLELWKRWVVEPKKRLSPPVGDVSNLPNAYLTDVYFQGTEDKAKFAKCLSDSLARAACSSAPNLYRGEMMPNDRLTVSKSSKDGRAHCLVTVSEGTRLLKERDKAAILDTGRKPAEDQNTLNVKFAK
jgi:hypothetical protein